MSTKQPSIDRFVGYVKRRGIADKFEPLYRSVATDLLRRFKRPALDMLGREHVKQYLAQEEQRLQNLRIVCVALDAYFADAEAQTQSKRELPPPRKEGLPTPGKPQQGVRAKPPLPIPAQKRDTLPSARASSPAFTSPEAGEQRRYVRIPFVREIEIEGAIGRRTSADLSVGGMYVEMGSYTPVGTVLQLRFRLEQDQPPIHLAARVVDGDPGGGVGVTFLDASPEIQARIQRYVERAVRS